MSSIEMMADFSGPDFTSPNLTYGRETIQFSR